MATERFRPIGFDRVRTIGKIEPMVLISSGQLVEQLGLDKTQRRFSFAQLTASAELQRLVTDARAQARRGNR